MRSQCSGAATVSGQVTTHDASLAWIVIFGGKLGAQPKESWEWC